MAAPIRFPLDVDPAKFIAGVRRAAGSLDNLAENAREADRSLRAMKDDVDVEIGLDDPALVALKARLLKERAAIEEALEVDVDIDVFKASRDLNRIDRQLDRLDRREVDVDVDIDRNNLGALSRLGPALTNVASGFTAIAGSNPYVAAGAMAALAGAAATLGAVVIPPAVGALLAGGGIAVGTKLLGEYAQFEAAQRKFKTVFGEFATDIEEWADAVSVRGGVGIEEIKGLAAATQDVLIPQGFSRSDAADITQSIVERGIALAEFSGKEKAEGIEAVTKALLGERESLKQLGVVIRQSEITEWIEENKTAVEGMSEGQQIVAATLALIEERSTDAWAAYQEGGGTAEQTLDTFRAKLANFKDDLVQGLGAPLVSIFEGLDFSGIVNPLNTITDWVNNNQATLKGFFLDLADVILTGADVALVFGQNLLQAFVKVWPALDLTLNQVTNIVSFLIEAAGRIADPTGILGIRDAAIEQAEATRQWGDSLRETGANFTQNIAPGIIQGFEDGREAISGIRAELGAMREESTLNIKIKAEQEGLAAVKADIKELSAAEAIDLAVSIDPASASDVERGIRDLAIDQIVKVVPSVTNAEEAEALLTQLAEPRQTEILAEALTANAEGALNDAATNRVVELLAQGKTDEAQRVLDRTAESRIADIIARGDTAAANNVLNQASNTRFAEIIGQASTQSAEQELQYLARARYATLYLSTVNTGGPIQEPGYGDATRSFAAPAPQPVPTMLRVSIAGREVQGVIRDEVGHERELDTMARLMA